ncbi:MAG: acylphosphatase [candidate division WOR-3 bacterium]|nr:MAG: acylphosphatase [candidate division WOR-3 bacterium]
MNAIITVQGVVQGVGYRFFVLNQARLYDIKGYVRNMPDGTVEVVAEGDEGIVKDFINRLRIGPVSAHVTGTKVKWSDDEQGYTEFRLQH